ncbi:MAG: hypothetical protein WC433_01815 [Candidatus Omnitrophota bacterium]
MSAKVTADTKRIDYLENNECEVVCDTFGGNEKWIIKAGSSPKSTYGDWEPTLRSAIDSAIDWNRRAKRGKR